MDNDMNNKILKWFALGRVGTSSTAMATIIAGIEGGRIDYPHDPDDFSRCLEFLTAVPEARSHMDKVEALSPEWARLVSRWDEIETSFNKEFRSGLKCREYLTYHLMQNVIKGDG
jgi:hypothetical protein